MSDWHGCCCRHINFHMAHTKIGLPGALWSLADMQEMSWVAEIWNGVKFLAQMTHFEDSSNVLVLGFSEGKKKQVKLWKSPSWKNYSQDLELEITRSFNNKYVTWHTVLFLKFLLFQTIFKHLIICYWR